MTAIEFDGVTTPADDFREYVEELVKTFKVPGMSVAVVKTGDGIKSSVQFYNFGKAYENDNAAPNRNTLYCIGSCSKAFAATALGLLIEDYKQGRGKIPLPEGVQLDWDSKAASLLPGEFKLQDEYASAHASLADLAAHNTGLPGNIVVYDLDSTPKDTVTGLRHLRPGSELRETFQYNNLMYTTLAYIIAKYAGESFTSFVTSRIFRPLGMNLSRYDPTARFGGSMAHCWDNTAGLEENQTRRVPFVQQAWKEPAIEMFAGPGGVLSCTSDMAKWVSVLLNNGKSPTSGVQVIPASVIERTTTGRSVAVGRPAYLELSAMVYGAGWVRESYQGRQMVWHNGGLSGFSTVAALFPYDGFSVVCISNGGFVHHALMCVMYRAAEDVLGLKRVEWMARYMKAQEEKEKKEEKEKQHATPPLHSQEKQPDLALYAGTYWHAAYGALTFGSWPAPKGSSIAQVYADYFLVHPAVKKRPEAYLVATWRKWLCPHLLLEPSTSEAAEAHEFQLFLDTIYTRGHGTDTSPFVLRTEAGDSAKVVFDVNDSGKVIGLGMWGVGAGLANGKEREGGIRQRAEVWFDKVL